MGVLFVVAGLCEIGGGYLVWGWMRDHRPLAWALVGGAVLVALYGVVAALQPIPEFGRVYAAYGGVFIALALAWGVLVDGFRTGNGPAGHVQARSSSPARAPSGPGRIEARAIATSTKPAPTAKARW